MYKECFNRNIKDERKLETQITYFWDDLPAILDLILFSYV